MQRYDLLILQDDFANNREFITVLVYKSNGKRIYYPCKYALRFRCKLLSILFLMAFIFHKSQLCMAASLPSWFAWYIFTFWTPYLLMSYDVHWAGPIPGYLASFYWLLNASFRNVPYFWNIKLHNNSYKNILHHKVLSDLHHKVSITSFTPQSCYHTVFITQVLHHKVSITPQILHHKVLSHHKFYTTKLLSHHKFDTTMFCDGRLCFPLLGRWATTIQGWCPNQQPTLPV